MKNKSKLIRPIAAIVATATGLLTVSQGSAAQFVELTTEIETVFWDNHGQNPPSVNPWTYRTRCVIGTNTWLVEGDFIRNAKDTWWFTGTNMIEQTVVTSETPEATTKKLSALSHLAMTSPHVGARDLRTFESVDGNPGRPVGVADLLSLPGKIAWLAYCSGPFLKREGRHIPLPNDLWKQLMPPSWETSEKTTTFEDEFGLPERIVLYTRNNQSVLQYRVVLSTNVLGWTFPLEFYLAQYKPARSNAWELDFTARGKLSAIGEGTEPRLSPEQPKPAGRQPRERK